ncbi:MAG: hypothetical protein AUK25_06725 [Desulfobacteraceae bacterium CG2_30_51_40]|nr:MAG: hypothetical protein AUK25_06725 [Desulfobacteraceae bacterium CG2_30_51_40]
MKFGVMKLPFKTRTSIVIIGAFLLALAIAYRFWPDTEIFGSSIVEMEIKTKQIQKYRGALREKGAVEARKSFLAKTIAAAENGLLTGKTPALAAVEIQNILDGIAKTAKGDIKTLRILKTEDVQKEPYVMVPVEFTLTSTIRQLKEIIYKIETSPKYLCIQQMRIDVARARGSSATIQSQITVAGIMRKEGV